MDEDARLSHRSWVGIDYTFMADVDATVKADLDDYLYQIAAHYFSMCKSGIQAWLPGMMYLGPDTLGTWGAPSNRNVLKAAAKYIDVVAMGGGWPLSQAMLDFMYTYLGDRPFYFGEFRTANADSAFFRYGAKLRLCSVTPSILAREKSPTSRPVTVAARTSRRFATGCCCAATGRRRNPSPRRRRKLEMESCPVERGGRWL